MGGCMYNLYIPICALMCTLLVVITFFTKKRIDNKETQLFSVMLIAGLIDCICMVSIFLLAYFLPEQIVLMKFLNKVDFVQFILWVWILFLYITYISIKDRKNGLRRYEKSKKVTGLFTLISFIGVILTPVELYMRDQEMYSYGMGPNIVYTVGAVYIVLIILTIFFSDKRLLNKKYSPFYVFLLLAILVMALRLIDPSIVIITGALAYANLIMYFTIENPDVKMIKEINEAKDIAEKANMAKSDFLSSMSHEIRTPLNAIVGLSEDIISYRACLPSDVIDDAEDIVNASNTLLEIVGNILDINKIESNKLEIVESQYNLKESLEPMIKVLSTRIGDKPIDLNVNFASDLPYELYGDKTHVKQIVNNLVSNAIKYTEKGHININIKCINKEENCLLFISVEDTGRGIKSENINRLFSKFDRLDIDRNTTTEGTGLGLAITKRLVEMMNGKINVESQFGKGSIFIVQIPQKISKKVNTNVNSHPLSTISEPQIDYHNKKILIVDDSALNIKVAKKTLDELHFIIDSASNGQECLDLIHSGKSYDLILMDIMMPVMSGETAFQELKKIPGFNTPVIALTADAVTGSKERYLASGFADYIAKPFNKVQIKEKLDNIFREDKNEVVDRFKDVPVHVIVDKQEKEI